MSPPNQGFRYTISLSAVDTTGALALVAACGASRGGGLQLLGTFVGTVQFEQSIDNGTTWIAKTVYPATGGAGVTSATGTGQWKFACGGETHVRVRCSAYTSGTIAVASTFTAGLDQTVVGTGTAGTPSGGVQSVQGVVGGTPLAVSVGPSAAALTEAKIDTAASGDLALVTATAAQTTKLYKLILVVAGNTNITFKDGATALTGAIPLGPGGSIVLDFDGTPWFTGTANTAFNINNSAAVQMSGRAYYLKS